MQPCGSSQGLSKQGIRFGDWSTVGRAAIIRPSNVLLHEAGEGMMVGDRKPFDDGPASQPVGGESRIPVSWRHQISGGERAPIRIEDDCWIGADVTALAHVTVGRGAVLAAGAVVTRYVSPDTVVGGAPARTLSERASREEKGSPSADL